MTFRLLEGRGRTLNEKTGRSDEFSHRKTRHVAEFRSNLVEALFV
jgi:hypothetical protein